MKNNTLTPRIFVVGIIAIILIMLTFVLLMNLAVVRAVQPYICRSITKIKPAQVAIVLGAKVFKDGRPSDMLADRLDTGIDLYKAGKVRKLLLTGDHGRITYDEVNNMRKYVLSKGIPAQDIFMDHAGFSTYDSMYRAHDIFEVKNAIIVTQNFHLARAVYTARNLGIQAFGIPADRHVYVAEFLNEIREAPARVKAYIDINLTNPKPHFLGPKIPIIGDGRLTKDNLTLSPVTVFPFTSSPINLCDIFLRSA